MGVGFGGFEGLATFIAVRVTCTGVIIHQSKISGSPTITWCIDDRGGAICSYVHVRSHSGKQNAFQNHLYSKLSLHIGIVWGGEF